MKGYNQSTSYHQISLRALNRMRMAERMIWSSHALHTPLKAGWGKKLAGVIADNGRLRELCIEVDAAPEEFQHVIDAIRDHPTLESVRIKYMNLPPQSIHALVEASFDLPQLRYLQLKGLDLPREEITHITQRGADHPAFSGLCLSKNPISDSAAEEISAMLTRNGRFQFLRLIDCGLSDPAMLNIAKAAAVLPDMVHFHLHGNENTAPQAQLAVPEVMSRSFSMNLISSHPPSEELSRACRNNRQLVHSLLESICEAHDTGAAESVLVHCLAESRIHAMRFIGRPPATLRQKKPETRIWDDVQAYLASLPRLEDGFGLLQADHRNLCPAETPATWQDAEGLFRRLEAAGTTIDREWLAQETPRGSTLLTCAMTAAPEAVLNALNARGIAIGAQDLFHQGSPSELLSNLIVMGSCNMLFTEKNWFLQSPAALRSTLSLLPPEARAQVRNVHSLRAIVDARQSTAAPAL